jgi:hypothetical protein
VQKRNRCFLSPLQSSSVKQSNVVFLLRFYTSMQSFDAAPPPVTLQSHHHTLPIQPSLPASSPASHRSFPITGEPWPRSRRAVTQPETGHQPQSISTSDLRRHSWVRNMALTPFPVIWFTLVGILVCFFYMSGNVLIAWW